jgi:hypothetical protein
MKNIHQQRNNYLKSILQEIKTFPIKYKQMTLNKLKTILIYINSGGEL